MGNDYTMKHNEKPFNSVIILKAWLVIFLVGAVFMPLVLTACFLVAGSEYPNSVMRVLAFVMFVLLLSAIFYGFLHSPLFPLNKFSAKSAHALAFGYGFAAFYLSAIATFTILESRRPYYQVVMPEQRDPTSLFWWIVPVACGLYAWGLLKYLLFKKLREESADTETDQAC